MPKESHISRYFGFDEVPQSILDSGEERRFKKGAIILRPGDEAAGFYVVLQGSVNSYHLSKSGVIKNVVYMEKNSIFFEKDVMLGTRCPYFFEADEDSILLFISADKLFHLLETDLQATRFIAFSVARKMHIFMINFDELQNFDSVYRICSTLIDLAGRFGIESNGRIKLDTNLSQQYLAELANVSRVTTVKNMGILKDEGLIEKTNDFYYITDIAALTNYMERFI